MARYFLVLALVLVLAVPCGSWLWSRRRCGRVNCQWGAWSAWAPCNHPCGNAGEQSRSRRIARNPSCGGSPCRGPTSETQACNRFCYNGGTPQPGYCDFPDEFWGRCSEKRTKNGDNDVLRWIETKQSSMKVKDVDRTLRHTYCG